MTKEPIPTSQMTVGQELSTPDPGICAFSPSSLGQTLEKSNLNNRRWLL